MMNSTTPQPAAIAAPGTYRIDAARSAIAFTTRHLFGLGTVHGTFTLREGTSTSPTRCPSPRPERGSPPRASGPAIPAGITRSGQPGCSTSERTLTSPSPPIGWTMPTGTGSFTGSCRCAGKRVPLRCSLRCSLRRRGHAGQTCACGPASASTATTSRSPDTGAWPPGISAAGSTSPPAGSDRAVTGCWDAVHDSDRC
jgi:hypothetical protein